MMKKILALLLALVLVMGLMACGSDEKPADNKPAATDEKQEDAKADEEEAAEPAEPETQGEAAGNADSGVVAADTDVKAEDILARDFSEHMDISFAGVQVRDALNYNDDNDYYKMWSERFNITYDVTSLPFESWVERLNTWINADDLPDWSVWNFNAGDAINYAEQGLVKRMPDDWREKYPNLAAAANCCEANAFYEKQLGGMYYFFRPVFATNYPADVITSHMSVWIRTDWAEQAGYDLSKNLDSVSITVSEFFDYCRAVKDAGITEYPWFNTASNVGVFLGNTTDHDGVVGNAYYLGEDGKYHWGPAEEESGVKARLKQIKQAYDDGLLYKEFYTLNSGDDKGRFYAKGDAAAIVAEGMAVDMDRCETEMQTNLDMSYWDNAVTLVLTDDNGIAHGDPSQNFWCCNIISPNISDEKLERILTMWDYGCTEQGQLEIRLGIEGVDWEKNEDGSVTNLLVDTEWGNADTKYTSTYPIYGNMFILSDDFSFVNPSFTQKARDRVAVLYLTRAAIASQRGKNVNWDLASYSSQELNLASMTYADEYANLITQEGDFDENYDKWVEDKMPLIQPVLDDLNAEFCE